jgi:hypothetical protein
MTAATEHSPEVPLLQSTEMFANVVCINIDWKASRHLKTLNTNMKRLGKTIETSADFDAAMEGGFINWK